ncbi:MAG: glycosyltransferase family 4 protein [Colwellia sp.]
MKILLSAYACLPKGGSEPGVGWNWLIESVKTGHSITVLTERDNCKMIEDYFTEQDKPENLSIIYHDLPENLMFIKRTFGIYIYYLLWQLTAYFVAKERHRKLPFDKVHHVTFATIRQPSFMGKLKIPFVYGPVGGGESPPMHLIRKFPFKAKLKEILRNISNSFVKYDPLMRQTFKYADKIVVTSEQTKNLIPTKYQRKIEVKLAIAQHEEAFGNAKSETKIVPNNEIKLLYVGRFEYWKGVHLCIQSLTYFRNYTKSISITLVGEGPYERELKALSEELGVSSMITWVPWISQEALKAYYNEHHVFVFPSLHDSGGMVVMEAMQAGNPVICLNLGGPATTVTQGTGIVIDSNLSESEVCKSIFEGIVEVTGKNKYMFYSNNARKRVSELTWEALVTSLL